MMIITILILALIPTILIELVVLLLLRERRKRVLASSVVVNVITNVPLNLYVYYVSNSLSVILLGEVIVILVETLWYYVFIRELSRSFTYSILCNAISFLTGLFVQILYFFFQNT
ncbi:MAG: hypothetical protein IJ897_09745 [Prevotella sp.]|nr:hypothetical protein [Prevotella sp.]